MKSSYQYSIGTLLLDTSPSNPLRGNPVSDKNGISMTALFSREIVFSFYYRHILQWRCSMEDLIPGKKMKNLLMLRLQSVRSTVLTCMLQNPIYWELWVCSQSHPGPTQRMPPLRSKSTLNQEATHMSSVPSVLKQSNIAGDSSFSHRFKYLLMSLEFLLKKSMLSF